METSLSTENLAHYVRAQMAYLFPDGRHVSAVDLIRGTSDSLARLEHCFKQIRVAKYCSSNQTKFNHLYSDQYLMFLWFLSNCLWRNKADENTLNKVYLLNKCLHGFDCAFDTNLPAIFIVIHGVGTVLGKAQYSNFFAVYQGCTVGQSQGIYPRIGAGVGLGAGSSLIGNCIVGNNASIGAGCTLVNSDVTESSTIFRGDDGKLLNRDARPAAIARQYFAEEALFGA